MGGARERKRCDFCSVQWFINGSRRVIAETLRFMRHNGPSLYYLSLYCISVS